MTASTDRSAAFERHVKGQQWAVHVDFDLIHTP